MNSANHHVEPARPTNDIPNPDRFILVWLQQTRLTGVNRSFRSTTNKFPYRFNRYQQQSGLWEKGGSRGLCGISKGGGKRGKPVVGFPRCWDRTRAR